MMVKYKECCFEIIAVLLIAIALYFSKLYDYLLFHSFAELFSVVIGFTMFIVAWHSKKYTKQKFNYLIFIGIAYFFISFIDLLHTLSYKGMPIFKDYDYYASQLWIAARYLESVSFLLPFIFLKYRKKLNSYITFLIYTLVTIVLIASIFYYKIFPVCFVDGIGQTQFKIVSEYIICFILFADAILIWKNKSIYHDRVYQYLLWSVAATIVSEFSFTLYLNVYDYLNLIGHYFKLLSFYLIYKAIIKTGLTEPYEISRKELDERKKALKKYKFLFDSIDEGFCIINVIHDPTGRPVDYCFIEVNPAFAHQTGLQNAEGKLISDLAPDFDKNVLVKYSQVALTGEPIRFISESKALDRWCNLYAFKIEQEDDSNIALLISDITEEVIEKQQMENSIKMQDEIFTNISHELKTPLNVIFSTIQLLEMYSKSDSLDAIKIKFSRSIDIMKQNCYRFTKLINNIVDLSKMDSGFIKLNLKNENIVGVAEDIVLSVSEFIREKELNIIFSTNIEEKVIAFDPDQIERVLLNLISNAVKFSNRKDAIYVSVMDQGDMVEISVKDTGIGIEKKHLELIFERFYQVDKTLSRNAEGTGIGLSLVKSIIEMHGGHVNIESEPGKGTTFKVSLPFKTVESSHEEQDDLEGNRVEMITIEFSDIYH